ncbi:hypothetical protein [Stutzerimonas azotifigens]|nr:hypothetical protein [Stutzerimonas azotifigens]
MSEPDKPEDGLTPPDYDEYGDGPPVESRPDKSREAEQEPNPGESPLG